MLTAFTYHVQWAHFEFDLSTFDTWQDYYATQESDSRFWAETHVTVWVKKEMISIFFAGEKNCTSLCFY